MTDPSRTSARAAGVAGTSTALLEEAIEQAPLEAGGLPDLPPGETRARSQWELFRRRFLRHKLAVVALIILILLALACAFAPWIAPYDRHTHISIARQPPSWKHWFGTDELGRDELTLILYAGQISLMIGLMVALMSSVLGTSIGAIAGFFGGIVDQALMRFTDLVLVVPGLAVLMIAGKKFGHSVTAIVVILAALFWMTVARVVRGVFLSLKEKEYVEAARASGASNARIIVRHMLPNTIGPIAVNTTLVVATAIITESTLSFLGFGVQAPSVSWGTMLAQAHGHEGTPLAYLIYFPGFALLLTVLAVNFLGDGLRDALDPQAKH